MLMFLRPVNKRKAGIYHLQYDTDKSQPLQKRLGETEKFNRQGRMSMKTPKKAVTLFATALLCLAPLYGCADTKGTSGGTAESKASAESKPQVSDVSDISEASEVPEMSSDISQTEASADNSSIPTEESVPEGTLRSGIFYHTYPEEMNKEDHTVCEAELCVFEDKLYLRLLTAFYSVNGKEDDLIPGADTEIGGIILEASVPVSEAEGDTFVFSTDTERLTLKYTAPDTIELLFDDSDEDDPRNGTYVYQKPDASRLTIPKAKHDPKSPDGKMDAGLAESARRTLNLSSDAPLTAKDCEKITSLIAYSEKESIINLDGIEYFKNMKEFSLSDSYVSDISPLTGLSELDHISFLDNRIEVIPDLSACTKLKKVEFTGEGITDIAPLAKIKNLEYLYMLDNRVKSIAPLKDNHTLKYLYIDGTCITDWESISDNETLRKALVSDYDTWLVIEKKAREVLRETITDDMTDLEKQIRIAQYIQDFIEYSDDYGSDDDKTYPIIYHGLIINDGVCNNYARTATYLMNMAGLEVRICEGSGHMWNEICLDGQWYEFDCTWNDNKTLADWEWFNRSRTYVKQSKMHGLTSEIGTPYAACDMPFMEYCRFAEQEE